MSAENLLMVADSVHDANMLYAVGTFVPDPFIYLRVKGRSHVVLNDLELDRGRREVSRCRVLSLSRCTQRIERAKGKSTSLAQVIRLLVREKRVKKLLVPETFPHGLARELRQLKVRVKVKPHSFFPEREIKTPAEVSKISAALMMAEVGMAEAVHALKNSKAGPGRKLFYRQVPLTSEKLRAIIDIAILQAGGTSANTIVAGGRQSCDPHEQGSGPLRANQPIIIDIFPRSQKTGYYGDITRTVVRGRATEEMRRAFHAVQRAQDLALSLLRPGASGAKIHRAVEGFFAGEGYQTGRRNGRMEGFFHGTGHGLGLEVHEPPRLSATADSTLQAGNVVTVEPGLYYAGFGGVRLEDMALITPVGARNLTKFEKTLEL